MALAGVERPDVFKHVPKGELSRVGRWWSHRWRLVGAEEQVPVPRDELELRSVPCAALGRRAVAVLADQCLDERANRCRGRSPHRRTAAGCRIDSTVLAVDDRARLGGDVAAAGSDSAVVQVSTRSKRIPITTRRGRSSASSAPA